MNIKSRVAAITGFGKSGPRFFVAIWLLEAAICAVFWVLASVLLGLPIFSLF